MSNQEFECNQKKRCDSFYVQAFENRKKYIEILKRENSELQAKHDKALAKIDEYLEGYFKEDYEYDELNCIKQILKGEQE